MSREQELGLDRNRKRFDARAEYFVSLFLFYLRSVSLLSSFSLSLLFFFSPSGEM
jgi:hypothetical protein